MTVSTRSASKMKPMQLYSTLLPAAYSGGAEQAMRTQSSLFSAPANTEIEGGKPDVWVSRFMIVVSAATPGTYRPIGSYGLTSPSSTSLRTAVAVAIGLLMDATSNMVSRVMGRDDSSYDRKPKAS